VVILVLIAGHSSPIFSREIITGTGPGVVPNVKVFDGASGAEVDSYFPYVPSETYGARVAAGDVNGDRVPDRISGLGPGRVPHVILKNGAIPGGGMGSTINNYAAYALGYSNGVYVAAGDVNGDGRADVVTGPGEHGGTLVQVFQNEIGDVVKSVVAFPGSTAEVRVAAGDVNGDGFADIIAGLGPSAGAGPHVKVFDGQDLSLIRSFFAYDAMFSGGVYVAAGDIDGDGYSDIITGAGAGGGTHLKVFSGATSTELASFLAFSGVDAEIRVGAGDIDDDQRDDIIVGTGPGVTAHVKAFSGIDRSLLRSFLPYGPNFTGGVYVAGVSAIPEPGSLVLAACGLLVGAFGRRNGRRR